MRYQGRIAIWKDDQGFGFITPNGGGQQVFVHIKSFANRHRRPTESELVTYELKADAKGRPQAENTAFIGERASPKNRNIFQYLSLSFSILFLVFVAGSVFIGKLPLFVFGAYALASTITFIVYVLDKSAAKHGRWRTKESTLHFFALAGGWPGALVAQKLLHHKSKKQSFQILFWATVILNCCALGWLFSPSGTQILSTVFNAP